MQIEFASVTVPVLALWAGGLFAVLVGFFIGFADSNVRSAKKIEAAETKAEIVRAEGEKKLAEAEALKASLPPLKDDPGVLRLKIVNGTPALELDGKAIPPNAISPEQRKRLIGLISALRPWVEAGGQPTAPPPMTVPARAPRPAGAPPATVSPVTAAVEQDIRKLSIVQQIDTILQARLTNTPLGWQGIRLQESLQGGVEVYVGVKKFSSIDEIPDETIKAAIRAAIAEWEQKYTPGG